MKNEGIVFGKSPLAIFDHQSIHWEPDFPAKGIYTLGMVLDFSVLVIA